MSDRFTSPPISILKLISELYLDSFEFESGRANASLRTIWIRSVNQWPLNSIMRFSLRVIWIQISRWTAKTIRLERHFRQKRTEWLLLPPNRPLRASESADEVRQPRWLFRSHDLDAFAISDWTNPVLANNKIPTTKKTHDDVRRLRLLCWIGCSALHLMDTMALRLSYVDRD